jgi:transaldolase
VIGGYATLVFADTADLEQLDRLFDDVRVNGFTTNPSLLRRAQVRDYEQFARYLIDRAGGRPVSLEVLSEEPSEMVRQGTKLASWGVTEVFVKVPIRTSDGASTLGVIRELGHRGVQVNVTAVMTSDDVESIATEAPELNGFVSIFAGRIADAGVDPVPIVSQSVATLAPVHASVIWASTREPYNLVQAAGAGCTAITMTPGLLDSFDRIGKRLDELSLESIRMFARDARESGISL